MNTIPRLVAFLSLVGCAIAAPQQHPHFDDGGALAWQTELGAAKKSAGKSDKMILIEYGRAA
ncbi:MAG: hypothetical protein H6835_17845 [Planctomycetes bacterium]|nr:hypothetical protein [Planctomycetota bacterium]